MVLMDVLTDSQFWALIVVQGLRSLTDIYLARKEQPPKTKPNP